MPIRVRLQNVDLSLKTGAADVNTGRFYAFGKVMLPLLALRSWPASCWPS